MLEKETATLENRIPVLEKSVAEYEKQENIVKSAHRAAQDRLAIIRSETEKADSESRKAIENARACAIAEKTAQEREEAAKLAQVSEQSKVDDLQKKFKRLDDDLDIAKRALRIAESEKNVVRKDTDDRIKEAMRREAQAEAKESALLKLLESSGIKLPDNALPKAPEFVNVKL